MFRVGRFQTRREGLALHKFGLHLRSPLAALVRGDIKDAASAQNNTVTRNVRAQAPPRLVLAPGVGM